MAKRLRKGKVPPNTTRLCMTCEKFTIWHYDRNVGRSYCKKCGLRYGYSVSALLAIVRKHEEAKK